eukprot:gene7239-14770_t
MSGFRGRGRGGRGRFTGRSSSGYRPQPQGDAVFTICNFYLDSKCQRGDSCRYSHAISVYQSLQAHDQPLKTIAKIDDGSRILTGSMDKSIKVWNPNTWTTESKLDFPGGIQHIEMKDSILLLSMDRIIETIATGDPVGLVQLINTQNPSVIIDCKKSEAFPYTHPSQIRSFCTAINEGELYLITAGGEGIIRTWKFNQTLSAFESLAILEGHIRAVTSLVLIGAHLWSGSVDRSIRCWDIATGSCIGTLTSQNGGHTEPVTCLEVVTLEDGSSFLASGGSDGDVIVWNTSTGESQWKTSNGTVVTALLSSQDTSGNRLLIVGLVSGAIVIRSLFTSNALLRIEGVSIGHKEAVWSMVNLGAGFFATGGEDGRLIVWKINKSLDEPQS